MPSVRTRWMNNYYVCWIPFCKEEPGQPLVTVATICSGCQKNLKWSVYPRVYVEEKGGCASVVWVAHSCLHTHTQTVDNPKRPRAGDCQAVFGEAAVVEMWVQKWNSELCGNSTTLAVFTSWRLAPSRTRKDLGLGLRYCRKVRMIDIRSCGVSQPCLWKSQDSRYAKRKQSSLG